MEAKIYNIEGKEAGKISLSEKVFGLPWNADLVHQVVVSMQSNKRSNTAHTKDRGEVRGGGKKPWQQKGTGRARHGSRRSPIWKGGGATHGPRNERNYDKKVNKKMGQKALAVLLSEKFRTGHIVFVDELTLKAQKTREAAKVITSLAGISGFEKLSYKKKGNALLAFPKKEAALEKSFRNLQNTLIGEVRNLNPLDLITHRYILIVNPKESVPMLEKRLA
ncbi:50S ribosomal protein L4 [Candidatus Parcubacteria bacterium]|nr:50S ribosomal protein L4 [Candidatus Parcubacteria bacterium]